MERGLFGQPIQNLNKSVGLAGILLLENTRNNRPPVTLFNIDEVVVPTFEKWVSLSAPVIHARVPD
jgi:hypothetical protein